MNKKFLALAVAAAMAAPVVATADAVMYGVAKLAVEAVDDERSGADHMRIQDYWSRLGVKGSEDLGNGLKGVYKFEFGVNIAGTEDEFQGQSVSGRNAYVGLAGNWGTLLLGRHDTPLKMSTGPLDYFGDSAGDYNLMDGYMDLRANGTLAYVTPSMGGLTVAAAIVPGENNAADGLADAYSVGAMYSNSGFYASAAIEGGDKEIDYLSTRGLNDYEQTRVGLGYDSGSWKVSGVWGNIDVENQVDQDIYTVSGAYSFGNNTLKAKYFDATDSHDGFAVGFDHALSKRTKAYALYTAADYEDNAGDKDIWGIGVNHAF